MPVHDWTLVSSGIFHDFHHEWISSIKRALNSGVLPPDYYALAEQVTGGREPDVLAMEAVVSGAARGNGGQSASAGPSGGPVALAVAPPKVRFTETATWEQRIRRLSRVAIRHVSGDRVVSVIELISPGNKSSRHAMQSVVGKAIELLDAGIHLLIVDLIPPGPRDPQGLHGEIWSELGENEFRLPPDLPLTLVAYSAGEPKRAFIEPVAVGTTLPDMPLFLEPELYVPVPLEMTYQAAFDAVPKRWRDVLAGH